MLGLGDARRRPSCYRAVEAGADRGIGRSGQATGPESATFPAITRMFSFRRLRLPRKAGALPRLVGGVSAAPERQMCAQLWHSAAKPKETARPFFSVPGPVARFFRSVLCSTRRHLERRTGKLPSEGEAFGWMLDHALAV